MQIILLQAERAWAYAMDLKQFANTESRKQVTNPSCLFRFFNFYFCLNVKIPGPTFKDRWTESLQTDILFLVTNSVKS